MHHHILREISKVGVGLLIADLASVIWFGAAGFFPLTILGVTWGTTAIVPIIVFDVALILLLAHYGWHTALPVRSPSERNLLRIAGLVFLIVSLLHLTRIAFGWELIIGTAVVPLWLSWVAVLLPAYLSYSSFHFAHRKGK